MNRITPAVDRLFAMVKGAQEKLDERDPAQAEVQAKQVLEEAARLGIRSPHAHWVLAVAHDFQGALEPAFEQISLALTLDPLDPSVRGSFEIIVRRIGEALCANDRDDVDPSTPRLYRLLLRAGRASVGAHLAMVRHHAAAGAIAEARQLAEAVTQLHPAEPQAWRALAVVARLSGDERAALEAEVQAASVAPDERPFGVPGMAEA